LVQQEEAGGRIKKPIALDSRNAHRPFVTFVPFYANLCVVSVHNPSEPRIFSKVSLGNDSVASVFIGVHPWFSDL